tara:strand:- start:1114 stop:1320 length:207 start_codon:yes stop_codon:yes gene_type:complete
MVSKKPLGMGSYGGGRRTTGCGGRVSLPAGFLDVINAPTASCTAIPARAAVKRAAEASTADLVHAHHG